MRSRSSHDGAWVAVVAIVLAVLALLAVLQSGSAPLPGADGGGTGSGSSGGGGGGSGSSGSGSTSTYTLTVGPALGTHLADPFWAISFTDEQLTTPTLQAIGAFLNATPIDTFRFGGGGAAYDPTTDTIYTAPGGGGTYVASHEQLWNLTWLKSWCGTRTAGCSWLQYLPGEENNTQAAVHFATWFHNVLGFAPTYWELGNEPETSSWSHFGENVTTWATTDSSRPTGLGYAVMVRDYISAVRAVFPTDQFIGLEASDKNNDSFVQETSALNGPNLAGMSFHSYPTVSGDTSSLAGFYSELGSSANVTASKAVYSGGVLYGCPTCTSLGIQLGEYNSGPLPLGSNPYTSGYSEAVFLGASAIEALLAGYETFTIYDIGFLYDEATLQPTEAGILYQDVLSNLTMGVDHNCAVSGSTVPGVYCVAVTNGTRESVLLVDTSTTDPVTATLSPAIANGTVGSLWSWGPGASAPTATQGQALPATVTVPAQGIVLVDNW